jgi:hypothetical protein
MKASLLVYVPSKSRDNRRWCVIQALVRSTIHLSSKHMKAFGQDLVPIDGRSFWCPHSAQTGPAMFDELETNPKVLLNPLLERITRIAAIYPDDLKARQVPDQRHKQLAASLPIAQGSAGAP